MAMIRACSYTATIQTPEAPSEYSAILITFAQDGEIILEKQKNSAGVTLEESTIVVQLDQTETKEFEAGKRAYLQIRCYKSQYAAPGSAIFAIDVWPALDDEVLS